jgi:hypothetical protein
MNQIEIMINFQLAIIYELCNYVDNVATAYEMKR